MTFSCKSCGHVQAQLGKCELCRDTDLVNENDPADPWRTAKERGDVIVIIRRPPGVWWLLDAQDNPLARRDTLAAAQYEARARGMAFRVEVGDAGI